MCFLSLCCFLMYFSCFGVSDKAGAILAGVSLATALCNDVFPDALLSHPLPFFKHPKKLRFLRNSQL